MNHIRHLNPELWAEVEKLDHSDPVVEKIIDALNTALWDAYRYRTQLDELAERFQEARILYDKAYEASKDKTRGETGFGKTEPAQAAACRALGIGCGPDPRYAKPIKGNAHIALNWLLRMIGEGVPLARAWTFIGNRYGSKPLSLYSNYLSKEISKRRKILKSAGEDSSFLNGLKPTSKKQK